MVTLNFNLFHRLKDRLNEHATLLSIIFMAAGITFLTVALISIFLNIYNPALISSVINGSEVSLLIFTGVLLIGVSRIFYNEPKGLNIVAHITVISIIIWIMYLFIFFYVRIMALSPSRTPFYISFLSNLQNSVIVESLRILLISALITYAVTFFFLFLFSRSLAKFSPITLGIGLIFGLTLVGDIMTGTMNNEFYGNLVSISGSNVMENFLTFSIILISLGLTVAFISYFFPKVNFLKLFFTLLIMALLLQLAFFYETSIAYLSGTLYDFMHSRYFISPVIEGCLEILLYAVICFIALEFSGSIKNRRSILELLSILIPVSGIAFIMLIVLKLIGSSVFTGYISINAGSAMVLYFMLIFTGTLTIFFSRTKLNKHGNFYPVVFPILILAIPMIGMFSINNTMNFQILLIYTIIIITSAIFIADTLSIVLSSLKLPVMGKLSISYIVEEADINVPEVEEKPSDQVIIDDTVRKPIPKYWIGKRIWGYPINEINDSFDPSFFHLFGVSSSGTFLRLSILVLKQYSSHGNKLAFDNNIIGLMERRFNGLTKLNGIKNIQQVLEIHSNSAALYMENQDNYKDAPPVVILEYIERRELTSLDWSLGDLKSRQVFFKVVMDILSSLEKAHSMGIIHGNICLSNVFIGGNTRLSEFSQVIGSDPNLDSLILSGNIWVKLGGFGGEVFDPYQYKEIFGFIPYYHPPEYAVRNLPAASSWDIYEISCLMYELLSGNIRHNNRKGNLWARINFIRAKIGNDSLYDTLEPMIADLGRFKLQPLYEINKNVSIDLWNAIRKGLDPNPKLRFESISEMKETIVTIFRENYRIG